VIILQAPEAAKNDTKVVDFDICVAELYIKIKLEIHADWDRWNLLHRNQIKIVKTLFLILT